MERGWEETRARTALSAMFAAAVRAADPLECLPPFLPEPPRGGRVVVVGVGKAAAKMALAVERAWRGVPLSGLVIAPHGAPGAGVLPLARIALRFGAHPVPDASGAAAARETLAAVRGLSERDLVLALVSGGGSSLATLPAEGLTLDDLVAVNRALLASGAGIHDMNRVRKHLSAFSGGRLAAAAHPARVVTLAISDVPGDDPEVIASGPTVPDRSTFAEAREVVARHAMRLPEAAAAHLARGEGESVKRLDRAEFRLVATPMMALAAMAEEARRHGLEPLVLGDALEGEARQVGRALAGVALSAARHGHPLRAPCVLLSGGETTVTLAGTTSGSGGRNTECLLAMALALAGAPGIFALCADTDGIDGKSHAAGAIATPTTLSRARERGLDPRALLDAHDSLALFDALGDALLTGPTLTNVNDARALLVTS